MSRKVFSPLERSAIWLANGQVCWLCGLPVGFLDMHVEHLLPVDLTTRPQEMSELLQSFKLAADFDLNSFENLRPSHSNCNLAKAGIGYDMPIVGMEIMKGRARAAKAREILAKGITDRKLEGAIAIVTSAAEQGQASWSQVQGLKEAVEKFETFAHEEGAPASGDLLIDHETVITEGRLLVVKQPYGVGVGPSGFVPDNMRCSCGNPFFNGNRCTLCGEMQDD